MMWDRIINGQRPRPSTANGYGQYRVTATAGDVTIEGPRLRPSTAMVDVTRSTADGHRQRRYCGAGPGAAENSAARKATIVDGRGLGLLMAVLHIILSPTVAVTPYWP